MTDAAKMIIPEQVWAMKAVDGNWLKKLCVAWEYCQSTFLLRDFKVVFFMFYLMVTTFPCNLWNISRLTLSCYSYMMISKLYVVSSYKWQVSYLFVTILGWRCGISSFFRVQFLASYRDLIIMLDFALWPLTRPTN